MNERLRNAVGEAHWSQACKTHWQLAANQDTFSKAPSRILPGVDHDTKRRRVNLENQHQHNLGSKYQTPLPRHNAQWTHDQVMECKQ